MMSFELALQSRRAVVQFIDDMMKTEMFTALFCFEVTREHGGAELSMWLDISA
jgi:hypothetical protein